MRIGTLIVYSSALVTCGLLTSCGFKKQKIEPTPPVKVVVTVADSAASVTGTTARSFSGTVGSGEGADLSFSVAGTIESIPVKQGQKVRKGQVLAVVKSGSLDDANSSVQAQLAEARDAYARMKKLHDAKALPDMQWVAVQTQLEQAEKAASIAARTAGDARITAPYDGIIAEKLADVGQTVAPAFPVLKIVGDGDVKVTIAVPETEVSSFAAASEAEITIDALGGRTVRGVLEEKGVVANPLTRSYDVRYTVPNPAGDILPGMICTVVPADKKADTSSVSYDIVIPAQAVLLSADNRHFVWIADGGKAVRRWVEQGDMVPDGIVITGGIGRGDSVIVAGMQKVSEGTPVVSSLK